MGLELVYLDFIYLTFPRFFQINIGEVCRPLQIIHKRDNIDIGKCGPFKTDSAIFKKKSVKPDPIGNKQTHFIEDPDRDRLIFPQCFYQCALLRSEEHTSELQS